MSIVWVTTLGDVRIYKDGDELTGLRGHRQKIALISYLSLSGPVSRDRLLGVFWPDTTEEKARHALSQAIYSLRKELGENIVDITPDQVSVPKQIVATDARQLEEEATREDWEAVVQLYQGPFMDQFTLPRAAEFEQWQTATRARIARLARRGFARVVNDGAERGDLKSALSTAYRWAELEPLEDEAQHTLIALLAQVGRRKEALSHFADYRDRLRQELEVDALDETLELVERIRAGGIPGAISLEAATRSRREAKERGGGHRLLDDSGAVISTDLEALLKDELGSRLQIVRLLREGSTASVYLAREPGLRRLVAVKVFSPSLASDSRARMRFERESQAIASLSHPNIVTVYWAGSLSNRLPYMVMQHVKGRTLSDRIKAEGQLDVRESVRILAAAASALSAAHLRGIVHRDVRPRNIFCEETTDRVLLADFGLAAILSTEDFEAPPRLTLTGELIGIPRYMSPEQSTGGDISEGSDIYSLALLGYEIMAGCSPYDAETDQEFFEAHASGRPRKLSEVLPKIDHKIETLLVRCLAKKSHHRPAAAVVARDLNAWLAAH